MIINKWNIISRHSFMATREGLFISGWIKSNGEEEIEILWLKGKTETFASLHPL